MIATLVCTIDTLRLKLVIGVFGLFLGGVHMAEAPAVKIKKEDGSPMDMLRKYFDVVRNSVHNKLHVISSINVTFPT